MHTRKRSLVVGGVALCFIAITLLGACSQPNPTPLPTIAYTPPPAHTPPAAPTYTPIPESYNGEPACSRILGAVRDHENGRISESEAFARLGGGFDLLDNAEPEIAQAGKILLNAVTEPPFRGGGALRPFYSLYSEGVEFRELCQHYGYW